jgi:CRP-like cAMP-binding protein
LGNKGALPFQAAEELMRALSPFGQRQSVERGDRLFSFGDAAKGVYLIVSGAARVSLPGLKGTVCHTAGAGSVLGLPAALCSARYEFDVEVMEPAELIFLETGSVNEILREHPALCMQVMAMMCDEMSALKQTRDHMRNCGKQSCSLHEQCSQCAME